MTRRLFLSLLAAPALPSTEVETLSGKRVRLPEVFGAQPAVVVWSFSREAGEKTGAWMDLLERERIAAWSAAMLEAAPRLIRPMIRGGMKKGLTAARMERSLLVYQGEKAWRQRLELRKEALPLLVLVDRGGAVAWRHEGLPSPPVIDDIRAALARIGH